MSQKKTHIRWAEIKAGPNCSLVLLCSYFGLHFQLILQIAAIFGILESLEKCDSSFLPEPIVMTDFGLNIGSCSVSIVDVEQVNVQ